MDEKNIDEIISDYLSKDIHLDEKNIKASKLALLDTIGCVFNATLNTSATIYATSVSYTHLTLPTSDLV